MALYGEWPAANARAAVRGNLTRCGTYVLHEEMAL